jgi:LysM repeat protein
MKRALAVLLVLSVISLSGCVFRTYKVTKDRIDQDLSQGNRGFIAGTPPPVEGERKLTRQVQTVEIELRPLFKSESKAKEKETAEEKIETVEEKKEAAEAVVEQKAEEKSTEIIVTEAQKYKVQEGDTLQKIAKKFYGSMKKWTVIYEANKANLKGPDKIFPGQVLDIPASAIRQKESQPAPEQPAENLK